MATNIFSTNPKILLKEDGTFKAKYINEELIKVPNELANNLD